MPSKKKTTPNIGSEQWTEKQYEEYLANLYGMKCIIGFTENGMPYGIFDDVLENDVGEDLVVNSNKDMPFSF